jgi:hypothetical protein
MGPLLQTPRHPPFDGVLGYIYGPSPKPSPLPDFFRFRISDSIGAAMKPGAVRQCARSGLPLSLPRAAAPAVFFEGAR